MRLLLMLCLAAGAPRLLDNPAYTPSSVVNAASSQSGAIAPNTIVTLYGERLAYGVRALAASDIRGNQLPSVLPGSGVRVFIANMPASIYYASPNQVNLLVPSDLVPGPASLRLSLDGRSGAEIGIVLRRAAPALFLVDRETAIATRSDGSLLTAARPARPGDLVVLYANGLGELIPPLPPGQLARTPAWLARASEFRVSIGGRVLEPGAVAYVGAAPGFAGLYQVNLVLPPLDRVRPSIRISVGDDSSPEGVFLDASPE